MANDTLKELVISHLRGSVLPFTLPFEKGKKLTVVYGENGTGKSTICDALDFLGKGAVGSLDNKGLGATRQYWHSLGAKPTQVAVSLKSQAGECIATIKGASVVAMPLDLRPRVEVLRRSQILKLVEARPAERYAAISKFIDVSVIETSENVLRDLIRQIAEDKDVAVARVDENRRMVEHFWKETGSPAAGSMSWAVAEVAKDSTATEAARVAVENLGAAYDKLRECIEEFKAKKLLCNSANDSVATVEAQVNALNGQVAGQYLQILEILQAAKKHFGNDPHPAICPLCESAEFAEGLPEKVDKRISAQQVATQLQSAKGVLKSKQQEAENHNQKLIESTDRIRVYALEFASIANSKDQPDGIELPEEQLPEKPERWDEWVAAVDVLRQGWKAIAESLADNKKFTATLRALMEALEENSQIKTDLDEVLPRLTAIEGVMKDERRKFTDGILKSIADEVGRLYEEVHPGEGLNKISMGLDPERRASLEISTEFQGVGGTPPQAYFSDSHLDTLGLCVFLALAQMDEPEEVILALDDVLGSVDEPHVDRLIEMLYQEALKFRQCIITTHYRPWKQKFRWGWLKHGQCQFVELKKWTPAGGIALTMSIPPDVEILRGLLVEANPDPQLVCAKAGVVLEAALDFLTLLYECKVPRRVESLHTLGDLLPAIANDKKLKPALRVGHRHVGDKGEASFVERQLAPHLEELHRIAQARNVFGCHFNALSFELLDEDALKFGTEVLALMDALVDHEAGWPKNKKSGEYWATAGDTRRLYPLLRPS